MTEDTPEARQAEHIGRLLRALGHTHTDECADPCEHEETLQALLSTPTGESA